jgi:hypothetical protein
MNVVVASKQNNSIKKLRLLEFPLHPAIAQIGFLSLIFFAFRRFILQKELKLN